MTRLRARSDSLCAVAAWSIFVMTAGAGASEPGAPFEAPVALEHVRIVTGTGETIDDGTILITQGRIRAVGRAVAVPAGAERIDGHGLTVYPGFIDANTHAGVDATEPSAKRRRLFEDESPDERDGPQSATVRAYRRLVHPHWQTELRIDPASKQLADLREAGFTAALLSPPDAVFAGHSVAVQLGDRPMRRQFLKTNVAQHSAFTRGDQSFSFDKRMQYPSTIMGAMALFRQVLLDTRWHASLEAWSARHPDDPRRVARDRDLESLRRVLAREVPVVFHANRENEIHRALDMAKEFGLRPMISGGREAWRVIDRLRAEPVPLMVSLKFGDEPRKVKPPTSRPAEAADEPLFGAAWQDRPFETKRAIDERRRLWEEEIDNCLRLHEAGIAFAFATDEHKSPAEFFDNLRKVIERGLPEDVAVAALSRNAAALLGLSDRLGTIEPGKLANLTVMTGPLADKKSTVRWVFIDGDRFEYSLTSKPEKPDAEATAAAGTQPTTTSQPATASAPADETEGYPSWPVELEADRHPAFQTGGNILLQHATLLTVTHDTLPDTDLLVTAGKIAEIGPGLTAPPGVATVDLTGYVVCPGLIEPHSHLATTGGLNEFTLSVTSEVRAGDIVNHRDTGLYRAVAGGVTTIHTMHGSANTIGGQNVILKLRYGRPAADLKFAGVPRTMKWALGENVSQKHAGRSRGTRFPNGRMGVVATIRRSLDAARKYDADWKAWRNVQQRGEDARPLRRDLRLEALADVLRGDLWVHCHCYRADEVLQLLTTAEAYGFRIAVLQHILEGYRLVPEIFRHGCGASTFSDWWAYKLEAYDAIPHNVARMIQGGIVATVNSDSGEVIRHLNVEAAKSMAYGGLDEAAALRLITLNGAIQLGIADRVGSLEVGMDADLAVFDGHPLDTFSKCVMTLIDGEAYFVHPDFDVTDPPEPHHTVRTFDVHEGDAPLPPLESDVYILTGGTVHPVSGPAMPDTAVVIRDGRIAAITAADDADIPEHASVVRIEGLHVWPGLIDAATSLGLTEIGRIPESVDAGEIGRFQPDLRVHWAINPHSELIDVARAGGLTTACILPRGGVIAGQAEVIRLRGWTAPEMLFGAPPRLTVGLPSLPINLPKDKRSDRISEHVKHIREIERYFQRARRYADLRDAADIDNDMKPPFDSRWEVMRPYIRGERPVWFSAQSYKQILEALAFADRVGARPIINGGRDAWKLADRLAEDDVAVILHGSTMYPERPFGTFDSGYRNAARLDDAGVRFCIAAPSAANARQLGVEAGLAVAHGLDPDRAAYAITLGAARILGIDDKTGSIEPGKRANLIVTTGHPCQASTRVLYEFIDGRPVLLESRHTRNDLKFRNRPRPDLPPPPNLRGPPPMRLSP